MNPDYFRLLFGYGYWATDRVVEAAAALPEADYMADRRLDYGSIHATLVHVLAGEWVWLSRWTGASPPRLLTENDIPTFAGLEERWREEQTKMRAFLASIGDADLEREVRYRNQRGEDWAQPLWQLLAHVVNHGTHHRSEAAFALTRLGHSPGDLDLIVYLRQRA